MPLLDKREREDAEVPGASLADIAFLLLIFFLLVTHFNVKTGIGMTLPPEPKKNQQPPKIKKRNLLKILVDKHGRVQIDGEITPMSLVKKKVKKFITNNGQDPSLSDSPQDALVSIKTARQTEYGIYIKMLDKVMGAYKEIRNNAALAKFGKKFSELEGKARKTIVNKFPKRISIANPESSS